MKIPTELYTPKSLATLSGASAAVFVATGVSWYVFEFSPRWLGLVIALVLAFMGLFQLKDKSGARLPITTAMVIVAFFNGGLIFVSATGINAINHSRNPVQAKNAAIVPFIDPIPWFPPAELVRVQDASGRAVAALRTVIEANQRATTDLESLQLRFRERRQLLEMQREGLLRNIGGLEASLLTAHPNEREAMQARLSTLRRALAETTQTSERARVAESALVQAVEADKDTGRPVFAEIEQRLRASQITLSTATKSLNAAYQAAATTLGAR